MREKEQLSSDELNITSAEAALLALVGTGPTEMGTGPAGNGKRLLVAGNRSGHLVQKLVETGADVTAHVFDAHHARAMRDRLHEAGLAAEKIVRLSDRIPEGPYDQAYFMTTPTSMTAELVLDQLEDIRANLSLRGELIAAFEGNPDQSLKTLKKVFSRVHVPPLPAALPVKKIKRERGVVQFALLRATKTEKDAAAPVRSFAADWPASVPGGETRLFTSLPGCFCHRRADPGGQALAEVACALMSSGDRPPAHGDRPPKTILDMGCGCGFVGLLVADHLARLLSPPSHLLLLDSHTRALAAARINAERLGWTNARYVLSDEGIAAADVGTCDLFLGNPPYFGDWRIAELFVTTAHKALKVGGRCLTVAKSEGGLKELQTRIFGDVEVVRRRGYFVFSSIRH